jgi:glucosyl-3-phosphoglycerate phosphatase
VLWRHGRTAWNQVDRFQGHTDVQLDDVGRQQGERAARLLAGLRPDAIVSSDLSRAAETAGALGRVTGLPVMIDPRLRETDGGRWQGRTVDELLATDGEAYLTWRSGADVPAGGAETRTQLAARVVPAILDALTPLAEDATLVVVTHGGSGRAAIGTLLGLDVERWAVIGGLSNCCWSVLGEGEPYWRLLEHNAGSLPEPVHGDEP